MLGNGIIPDRNIMAEKPRGILRKPYTISILICIVAAFMLSLKVLLVDAAVTLVYFTATPGADIINIKWKTATEFDNAGFFVQRSLTENGQFDRLPISQPEFIFAEGDGPTGAEYKFIDEDVTDGITYYYKLEAIGLDNSTEIFGPVSAVIGDPINTPTNTTTSTATPTNTDISNPTNTPTRTPTKTQTSQSTSIGVTFTATRTPSKTLTRVSAPSRTPFSTAKPPTNTPVQSGSQESTPTSTITFAPQASDHYQTSTLTMPAVSMSSDSFSSSNDPGIKSNPSDDQIDSQNDVEKKTMSLVRTGLIIGVFALWGVLAVVGYYFIRQRRS